MKEQTVSAKNNGSFTMDINALPGGLYYVQMDTKSGIESKSFIKE